MNNKEYISSQITQLQAASRLYDDAICDVLDIHRTTFYKKKRGLSRFKPKEVKLLADLFKVDEGYITDPDYIKLEKPPVSSVAEELANYEPIHEPSQKRTTITLSFEIPVTGGLRIPEDINEQIIRIIENSN